MRCIHNKKHKDMSNNQKKDMIGMQYNDMVNQAEKLYPDLKEYIASYSHKTAFTDRLQDYLNLTMQTPFEISTNRISLD